MVIPASPKQSEGDPIPGCWFHQEVIDGLLVQGLVLTVASLENPGTLTKIAHRGGGHPHREEGGAGEGMARRQ